MSVILCVSCVVFAYGGGLRVSHSRVFALRDASGAADVDQMRMMQSTMMGGMGGPEQQTVRVVCPAMAPRASLCPCASVCV